MLKKLTIKNVRTFLGSSTMLKIVLGLFILQSVWSALSNAYPMAFDEGYHLGVIKLYASHPSPFWGSQPAGASSFGPIFRDPSYMYHLIMLVPYKLISLFTHNQAVQVIILRFINIGLFTWSLLIFRRLMLAMKAPQNLANSVLLIFVLIPVVSQLAGQINYDNLLMPITALMMLWAVQICTKLKETKKLDAELYVGAFCLGLFGIMVKAAFLPFFAAGGILVTAYVFVSYKFKLNKIVKDFVTQFGLIANGRKLLLISLAIIFGLLAVERYGLNYVRYHSLVPDCGKLLSIEECKQFGPWGRDYALSQNPAPTASALHYFAYDWLYGMWFRLFFAVSGPDIGYVTRRPYLPPGYSFIALFAVGLLACIAFSVRLYRLYGHRIVLPLGLSLFYITLLFMSGLGSYHHTGKAVAINGRYLLPVLIPLMTIGGLALAQIPKKYDQLKLGLFGAVVVCMLWGGGVMTFILRSDDAWYWNNSVVRSVNDGIRKPLAPLVPESIRNN